MFLVDIGVGDNFKSIVSSNYLPTDKDSDTGHST